MVGGIRWSGIGAVVLATQACMAPPMNVGRPLKDGKAVTFSMGQSFGNAVHRENPWRDTSDDTPDPPPEQTETTTSEGLGIPGSATLGLRVGLGLADLGGELSFAHAGLNSRILVLESAALDLVLTLDARIGVVGLTYDGTTRVLAFVPLRRDRTVFLLGGFGTSAGKFNHYTFHRGFLGPTIDPVQRMEGRGEALLGVSFTRVKGAEIALFADGYYIPWSRTATSYGYEQTLGILFATSITVPLGSTPSSRTR